MGDGLRTAKSWRDIVWFNRPTIAADNNAALTCNAIRDVGVAARSSGTPWTYDNTGKLLGIPSLITTTSYNAAGQVTHIGYQNGVTTDNTYRPQLAD
jgi:hypothetical protein